MVFDDPVSNYHRIDLSGQRQSFILARAKIGWCGNEVSAASCAEGVRMRYLLVGLMMTLATPATAQLSDPLAMTTDPADQAIMAEVAVAISARKPDLAKLDTLLAKLPRPTPLRGMVQTVRAMILSGSSDADQGPATAAIEEALRLLPDDPRPKLAATFIFTFSGAPQRAADLWMQASRQSPELARMSDRYVMSALIGRLREFGDSARADRVAARLGEIGFSAALASERSNSALANTRQAVRDGRDSEALSGVTAIGDPDDVLTLYVDRRYEMVWPRIAEWAAPDLSDQSRRYLEELRSDWNAADDFHTAAPYAQRLAKMRSYAAVAQLFPPMFDRLRLGAYQEDAERLAPIVARALAVLGRDTEARSLLDRVAAAMPADTVQTPSTSTAPMSRLARSGLIGPTSSRVPIYFSPAPAPSATV